MYAELIYLTAFSQEHSGCGTILYGLDRPLLYQEYNGSETFIQSKYIIYHLARDIQWFYQIINIKAVHSAFWLQIIP